MNPKLRVILAILAGILAGGLSVGTLEMLLMQSPPENLDLTDRVKMGEWIGSLPVTAFAILLLAYFFSSAVGGWVANRISAPTKYRPALIVGFGLFVAGLMNVIAIPHPMWFSISASLIYFMGAWIGGKAANRTKMID